MVDSEEDRIRRRITDFTTGRALAQSSLSNTNHAFYEDLLRVVKHCDKNLVLLKADLKKLQEKKCRAQEENHG